MGLEEVVGDIEAAGKASAEAIVREAEQERGRLLSEARAKAGRLSGERLKEAERALIQLRARELSGAELEVKRLRLSMETELLEAAAAGARDRVARLTPAQDEALLRALLKRGEGPQYGIYSAKRNEAFLRTSTPLPYKGNIDCLGGLVLESADGTVRMDLTYDTILRDVVERDLWEIHKVLFPK